MAIKKCPECGKEISDTSRQCVHCGCKFSVCPDCGTLFIEGPCPNCGYQSRRSQPAVSPSTSSAEEKSKPLLERWKESDLKGYEKKKILSFVYYGFETAWLILLTVWFVSVFMKYLNPDPHDLDSAVGILAGYGGDVDQTYTYAAIICILMVIGFGIGVFRNYLEACLCSDWLRSEKRDIKIEACAGSYSEKGKATKIASDSASAIIAYCLALAPNRKSSFAIYSFFKFVITAIPDIMLFIWGRNVALGQMSSVMTGIPNTIDWIYALIVGAACLGLEILFDFILKLAGKSFLKKYL